GRNAENHSIGEIDYPTPPVPGTQSRERKEFQISRAHEPDEHRECGPDDTVRNKERDHTMAIEHHIHGRCCSNINEQERGGEDSETKTASQMPVSSEQNVLDRHYLR